MKIPIPTLPHLGRQMTLVSGRRESKEIQQALINAGYDIGASMASSVIIHAKQLWIISEKLVLCPMVEQVKVSPINYWSHCFHPICPNTSPVHKYAHNPVSLSTANCQHASQCSEGGNCQASKYSAYHRDDLSACHQCRWQLILDIS